MRAIGLLLLIGIVSGCATFSDYDNLGWARKNNIPLESMISRVPDAQLEQFIKEYKESGLRKVEKAPHLSPQEREKLRKSWEAFDSRSPCFFKEPNTIFVREGYYPSYRHRRFLQGGMLLSEDVYVKRSYEEFCLGHEVGHFRDYLEGVPYGSKYAPHSNFRR